MCKCTIIFFTFTKIVNLFHSNIKFFLFCHKTPQKRYAISTTQLHPPSAKYKIDEVLGQGK